MMLARKFVEQLSGYTPLYCIGKGSFAQVLLCECKSRTKDENENTYALKIINKTRIKNKRQARNVMTERDVMSKLDYPFIVRMRQAFHSSDQIFMVLDFCPGGDMYAQMREHQKFEIGTIKHILAEVALSIGYLHGKSICYRDMKPENVLLDEQGHAKLSDFGLARTGIDSWESGASTMCGTPQYMAPEVFLTDNYGRSCDYWALGVMAYEWVGGVPPFRGKRSKEIFHEVANSSLVLLKSWPAEFKSFLAAIVRKRPWHRLGAKGFDELRTHEFFADMDWVALQSKELASPSIFVPNVSAIRKRNEEQRLRYSKEKINFEFALKYGKAAVCPAHSALNRNLPSTSSLQQQQQQQQHKRGESSGNETNSPHGLFHINLCLKGKHKKFNAVGVDNPNCDVIEVRDEPCHLHPHPHPCPNPGLNNATTSRRIAATLGNVHPLPATATHSRYRSGGGGGGGGGGSKLFGQTTLDTVAYDMMTMDGPGGVKVHCPDVVVERDSASIICEDGHHTTWQTIDNADSAAAAAVGGCTCTCHTLEEMRLEVELARWAELGVVLPCDWRDGENRVTYGQTTEDCFGQPPHHHHQHHQHYQHQQHSSGGTRGEETGASSIQGKYLKSVPFISPAPREADSVQVQVQVQVQGPHGHHLHQPPPPRKFFPSTNTNANTNAADANANANANANTNTESTQGGGVGGGMGGGGEADVMDVMKAKGKGDRQDGVTTDGIAEELAVFDAIYGNVFSFDNVNVLRV